MSYQFIFFEEHFLSLQNKTSFAKNYAIESQKNLEREYIRLVKVFNDKAVELNNAKKAKAYFNLHQQHLTILMDRVSCEIAVLQSTVPKKLIIGLLETILDKMEKLMNWMKTVFQGIFDYMDKVPKKMIRSEEGWMRDFLNQIIVELQRLDIEGDLLGLTGTLLNVGQIVSFRDLEFWKTTCSDIYRNLAGNRSIDEFGVIKIFLENGVNHRQLYNYTREFIKQEVEKKTTLGEQISSVCLFRKEMRTLFIRDQKLQFEKSPDIRGAIKKFLREELLLLRAMEFVNHEVEEAGIMNANYKVSFSVKQLAFFVHLQMETGIIIWQRAKFAHQYIARHFSTVERDSISEKSARNAHYNHASEDIKKVITKLSEMLALAQERY